MHVYDFILKPDKKAMVFEELCAMFYSLGNVKRKVDEAVGPCVYAVSRDPETGWVQILVDENTPNTIIMTIERLIEQLSTRFIKYKSETDNIAPSPILRTDNYSY